MSGRPAPRRSPARRTGAPRNPANARPAKNATSGIGGEQVEGRQAILELLRAKTRNVRRILMADAQDSADILDQIEDLARRQRVAVQLVSRARLDREARTEGHQGVVAFADPLRSLTVESLLAVPNPFFLVCDGVTDPRNLGAMLRSADGAGVTGVLLPKHRAARITPAVTKTAAGAIEYLAFGEIGGVPSAIDSLNRAGVMTIGLAGGTSNSLFDLDMSTGPVALVVGGEQNGLAPLTRKRCAAVVSIPQRGHVSSLNAGAAVSVAVFEVARQRH